jgi:hypothetical protein
VIGRRKGTEYIEKIVLESRLIEVGRLMGL